MQSLLGARQWELRYWKKTNLNRCLLPVNQNFQEKELHYLVLMAGGDGEWMRDWETRCKEAGAVLICESVTAMKCPMMRGLNPAKRWVKIWVNKYWGNAARKDFNQFTAAFP